VRHRIGHVRPGARAEAPTDLAAHLRRAVTLHTAGYCADALHNLTTLLDDVHRTQLPDTAAAVLDQFLARHAACSRLTTAFTYLIRHPHLLRSFPGIDRSRLARLTISTTLEHRSICRMPPPCHAPAADLQPLPTAAERRMLWNHLLGPVPPLP
jgi:hypothetical protein